MLHAVIMAGGSGTRFWPASRSAMPKQLLQLVGARTMLQTTVDRVRPLAPPERILVVTGAALMEEVARQLPELPPSALLGEPCRRDTAPGIGLAALLVLERDPQAVMAVMPSDHVIGDSEAFVRAIRVGADLVAADPGRIVTFGIRPTYPAESFGYIERGAALAPTVPPMSVYQVRQFREKPKAEIAKQYLAAGTFYWNSGIFVWHAATIVRALEAREPQMMASLRTIVAASGGADFAQIFAREFSAIHGISIDYAVMEHAQDVLVIEAPFAWDDVGSWQAITRLQGTDAEGNTIQAKHVGLRTNNSIVRGPDGHLIVTLGLKDTIVVHTPDATLVANKHDEEAIRELVKLIAENGWQEYL